MKLNLKSVVLSLLVSNVAAANPAANSLNLNCRYLFKVTEIVESASVQNDSENQLSLSEYEVSLMDMSGPASMKTSFSHMEPIKVTETFLKEQGYKNLEELMQFDDMLIKKNGDLYAGNFLVPGLGDIRRVMQLVGLNEETTLVPNDGLGTIFIPFQDKKNFLFAIDAKNPSKLVPQIIVFNADGLDLSIDRVLLSTSSRRIKKTFVMKESNQDTGKVVHFSASCVKK